MMTVRVADVMKILEEYAPQALAEEWDHIGIQVGHEHQELRGIAVALDPSLAVVEETLESGCNVLITHHPLLFRPLHHLDSRTPLAILLHRALQEGLCVIAAHTNLDSAGGGINDLLAARLGLKECRPLSPHGDHPAAGLGRIGRLPSALSQNDFIGLLKRVFVGATLRVCGRVASPIEQVALCSGSGREFLALARRKGAHCYITADVHYHDAVSAWEEGPLLVDPGHFAMEVPVVSDLAKRLRNDLDRRGARVPVVECRRERDPFAFL